VGWEAGTCPSASLNIISGLVHSRTSISAGKWTKIWHPGVWAWVCGCGAGWEGREKGLQCVLLEAKVCACECMNILAPPSRLRSGQKSGIRVGGWASECVGVRVCVA
jgi:hypothetical protein